MKQYEIGVVVPVYNSQHSIATVTQELCRTLRNSKLNFRVILVNDGSSDHSGEKIDHLAAQNCNITAVHLTRNFGQQSALLCGISLAAKNCSYIVTMDDDLQHPMETERLYAKIREGYDLVYAIASNDERCFYRRVGSALRDLLFDMLSGKPRGVKVSSLRIMTAELAEKIAAEQQSFVYLSASAMRYRPKIANISFELKPRKFGKSGYTLQKLAKLYGKLFLYYTHMGRYFVKKSEPPYEIKRITEVTL